MHTLCFDTFGRGGRMRGVRAFDFFDARLDLDADDFLPAADFMSVSYSSSEVSLI